MTNRIERHAHRGGARHFGVWVGLFACGSPAPPATGPEAPAHAEARVEPARVELAWVRASSLNVRDAPDASAAVRARLALNAKLAIVERRGDWLRVSAPGGEAGWVAAAFVADAPLTLDAARQGAADATTDAERLSWWQRAAALAPEDPDVLTRLEAAYTAVGDTERARGVARARATEGSTWERWFAPDVRAEAEAIGAELRSVRTPEAFGALHARALASASALSGTLNERWDVASFDHQGPSPADPILARLPWLSIGFYAEGTYAQLELAPRAWTEAAERTPGDVDDAFVKLVVDAYGNAGGTGWPSWGERTWDYGGCSLLGTGLHPRLLLATDRFRDVPWAGAARAIRRDLLADITVGNPEFPYCDPVKGPTDPDRLRLEVEAIRDEVALTPDERTAIDARLANGFAPTGDAR